MNTKLFSSRPEAAPTDAVNEAGGKAYALSNQAALAQYACTGCLNRTYYASDKEQLKKTLELCAGVDLTFVAKTAVYARRSGFMKDMPAVLCAFLASKGPEGLALLKQIFPQVIDNGRMLRGFVQVIRSGVTGRKSMGTAIKRLVAQWILSRDLDDLLNDSVGNTPSVADLIKMVHPKPLASDQKAAYAYLIGRPLMENSVPQWDYESLPELYRQYEAFKKAPQGDPPAVHFNLLTALTLNKEQWATIARNGSWHFIRMNLNTFARHEVFSVPGMVKIIADKLKDAEAIKRSKVFPYQLLAAYLNVIGVPDPIKLALQDAMEIATYNVPKLEGYQVYACPDTSGSMSTPVTGHRKGATTSMECRTVAGLIAATLVRTNEPAQVLPFDTEVQHVPFNPRDSVMTNAQRFALNGGGTDCSAPLRLLNKNNIRGQKAAVVMISDNESWYRNDPYASGPSAMAQAWLDFKRRNPGSKLICIDLQPAATIQVPDDRDVMNLGGFSDNVWPVIASFLKGGSDAQHWVQVINGEVELAPSAG